MSYAKYILFFLLIFNINTAFTDISKTQGSIFVLKYNDFLQIVNTEDKTLDELAYNVATIIIKDLSSYGLTQVGNLNLNNLIAEFKFVKFRQSPIKNACPIAAGGLRSGIVNYPEHKIILFCDSALFNSPELTRQVLLLHEYLGATGYDDENYQLSLGLWLLRALKIENKYDKFINSELIYLFQSPKSNALTHKLILADGGVTSTGPGGDPFEIYTKFALILQAKQFLNLKENEDSACLFSLYKKILLSRIEVDSDYLVQQPVNINKEHGVIFIPLLVIQNKFKDQDVIPIILKFLNGECHEI